MVDVLTLQGSLTDLLRHDSPGLITSRTAANLFRLTLVPSVLFFVIACHVTLVIGPTPSEAGLSELRDRDGLAALALGRLLAGTFLGHVGSFLSVVVI